MTPGAARLLHDSIGAMSTEFQNMVLPHLNAAYNLARWLTRNEQDAQDIVQEAGMRAYAAFDQFRGDNGKAWFLTIVRNTFFKHIEKQARFERFKVNAAYELLLENYHEQPEEILTQENQQHLIHQALAALPEEFREVIILREMEGLSYQEIATIISSPVGTVMSRLSRARRQLQHRLLELDPEVYAHVAA